MLRLWRKNHANKIVLKKSKEMINPYGYLLGVETILPHSSLREAFFRRFYRDK